MQHSVYSVGVLLVKVVTKKRFTVTEQKTEA